MKSKPAAGKQEEATPLSPHRISLVVLYQVHLVHEAEHPGIGRVMQQGLQAGLVVVHVLLQLPTLHVEHVDEDLHVAEDAVTLTGKVALHECLLPASNTHSTGDVQSAEPPAVHTPRPRDNVLRKQPRPCSTLECNQSDPSHGVPCQGLLRETDQFRLDPTKSSAPGRLCDRVSSVSTPHILEVRQHLLPRNRHLLALTCMPTYHHLHSCPHQIHHSEQHPCTNCNQLICLPLAALVLLRVIHG